MNTGTSAAKERHMVDLDSDPDQLIEIVEIGKQVAHHARCADDVLDLQRHRQVLRDHPRAVRGAVPGLDLLNIMRLHSPQSAILSAVIFNALVIIALYPVVAARVRYTPASASKLLSRNLYIYGSAASSPVHRHQADRPRRTTLPRNVT